MIYSPFLLFSKNFYILTLASEVTILREPLFHICRDSDEDPAPSGRTYKADDLNFIKKDSKFERNQRKL